MLFWLFPLLLLAAAIRTQEIIIDARGNDIDVLKVIDYDEPTDPGTVFISANTVHVVVDINTTTTLVTTSTKIVTTGSNSFTLTTSNGAAMQNNTEEYKMALIATVALALLALLL